MTTSPASEPYPKPAKQPRISIVVVTYNGLKDTLACMKSLEGLTYKNVRVILVDQNSVDGTPAAIKARFPWVHLIENPVNDGFTGGNNLGMRAALADGADYVFLLNNDTEVEPQLLEKLVEPMEADKSIGIIGPLMLYFSDPNRIWWCGSNMTRLGRVVLLLENQLADNLDLRMRETGYVCGCGMLIRRKVLDTVGLLDDRFFIYYEEADLCARTRRAGWKLMCLPSARLWHKVSQVIKAIGNDFGLYHMSRNRVLYLWKNGEPRFLCCVLSIGSNLKQATLLFFRGHRHEARVVLRGLRDALTGRWGSMFFKYKKPLIAPVEAPARPAVG